MIVTHIMIQLLFTDVSDQVKSKMMKSDKVWQCTDCDYKSTNKANVYKHVESKHVPPQYYSCEICSKVCKGINSYNVHYYNTHKK